MVANDKNIYIFDLSLTPKPQTNEKTTKKRHSARTDQRWLFAIDDLDIRVSFEKKIPLLFSQRGKETILEYFIDESKILKLLTPKPQTNENQNN